MSLSESEREFHRKTAARCFNEAWDYLEKKDRSPQDEQQMLHLVHAARYHRSFVGEPINFATGNWQISRAYAAINQPGLALQFAKSSLEICQKENLEILCTAYEAMARAYAVSKDYKSAVSYIKKAHEALNIVKDKEERGTFLQQIRDTEALIPR